MSNPERKLTSILASTCPHPHALHLHTYANMHMIAQTLEIRIYETTGEIARPLRVAIPPAPI